MIPSPPTSSPVASPSATTLPPTPRPPAPRSHPACHVAGGPSAAAVTFAVLGVHGGAGASTVAALLRGTGADAEELSAGQIPSGGAVPVLVTRSTAAGTATVAAVLAAWEPGRPRPWLVVVADVPAPAPLPVRYRLHALGAQVRGVVHVPYLWPLRAADDPGEVIATRALTRAAARLRSALLVEETP